MSLVSALQSGNYNYLTGKNNSNVSITTGTGNSNIDVVGGNISISTGNGNQTITADAANNLNISTGSIGTDVIKASAFSAIIDTNDSNDTIILNATSFDIDAGNGDNTVAVKGDTSNKTAQNSIKLGNGNDTVIASANNLSIEDGNGSLTAITCGDNTSIESGNGTHSIAFWGDNIDIKVGDGNANIQTLDKTIATASSATLATLDQYGIIDAIEDATTLDSIITSRTTIANYSDDPVSSIIKQYNLSGTEAATLKSLYTSGAIYDTYKDGTPKYVIVKSPQLSSQEGKDVYVIAARDGDKHTYSVNSYKNQIKNNPHNFTGDGRECIATSVDWATDTESGYVGSIYKDTTTTNYLIDGTSNASITTGSGTKNIALTAAADGNSTIDLNLGNGTNNVSITNGFTVSDVTTDIINTLQKVSTSVFVATNTYNSPLVLDTNKDGKVSATAGTGVDVDGDGIADGAATDGDKMLAMSDMNANGQIDGTEVFGNKTVNPFTGEAINAANGFEALKLVAQSAESVTGLDCIDADGNVTIATLKQALATVGVNLGFISDANNTELEDIKDVTSINTSSYKEVDATGAVQNRQLGSYVDADGNVQSVDDVWFASSLNQDENFFKTFANFTI